MEININELRSIVRTLPIGLYAKRGVIVAIGEKDDTSYYSPTTDEIVVSYPQICVALSKVPQNSPYKERIIRGVLYHEVSHAFMTPEMRWNDVVNVFEDERMETLLADYYHDVDFKTNVFLFNGLKVGEVPPATDKFTAFYNLVRFRSGSPEMLERVSNLIQKYKTMTKTSDGGYSYYWDIMRLYDATEVPPPEQSQSEASATNGEESDEASTMDGKGRESLSADKVRELFDEVVSAKTDTSLLDYFQTILDNFSKKNSGGSSISGYSGVLNTRSVGNANWKIFDRPFTERSSNAFGTFHLNLFIDCSGSFGGSEKIINKVLSALSLLEKRNPNFTLDVVFCGVGEKLVTTPRERVIRCRGGNNIDDNIYGIYRSLQKPNTYNYNIVLFDGDAFTNANRRPSKTKNNFKAFDFANCTIISDEANRYYIEGTVNRAKTIYTKQYTNELLDNLKTVLSKAFR